MYEELAAGPRTTTELARVGHELSFHQVSRRANLFLAGGLIREARDGGRRRRYELTEEARRASGLIAGLGRWRERHVVAEGEAGLTEGEAAELLRAALPLLLLPEHSGERLELAVGSGDRGDSGEEEVVGARVDATGRLIPAAAPADAADGRARGKVGEWLAALLSGSVGRIRVGGEDPSLVKATIGGMHEALWGRRDGAVSDRAKLPLRDHRNV